MLTFRDKKGNVHEIDDAERTRCEIWSRVMGYMRPVSDWNIGKQSEYAERVFFNERKTIDIINSL